MPLIPVTRKLAPSTSPYAFRITGLRFTDLKRNDGTWVRPFSAILPAMWLGRKDGETTITLGTYTVFADGVAKLSREDSLEDLLAKADTRYGGTWHQKLDGESLLMEPAHRLSVGDQTKTISFLQGVLDDPETLPSGWLGWFKKDGR